MTSPNYIIVGAGVFGVSTALHLAKSLSKTVLLVDRKRPNPGAASSDYNKIVRADYPDTLYASMALEAIQAWKNDPIFSPFFHQRGILFVEELGMGRASLDCFKKLKHDSGAEIMTLESARTRFPAMAEANWKDGTEAYFNPESGWCEADGALASALRAAEAAGVTFLEADVVGLELGDDEGTTCQGIRVRDGPDNIRTIRAIDHTILSVGAHTARFLADTAPQFSELQVNGRMVAAGAVQCAASYDPEEEYKLDGAPCHFLGMWHTHGESIPPFNGLLKFNCEVSFTNNEYHAGLDKMISVPPSAASRTTFGHDVPDGLKQEVSNVVQNVFGNHIKGLRIESYRMCWDAVSPNQDWIIDQHPSCKNLLIAGAGSFHAWKFLPNVGKYVTQRLLGQLDQEKQAKWAWDRSDDGAACEMYIPTRDLSNIGPFNGWPRS